MTTRKNISSKWKISSLESKKTYKKQKAITLRDPVYCLCQRNKKDFLTCKKEETKSMSFAATPFMNASLLVITKTNGEVNEGIQ